MTNRHFGILGLLAPVVFIIAYVVASAQRPDYSLFTKAVSELGSLDAPQRWFWNVFGFSLTGLLIAAFGFGLRKISGEKRLRVPMTGLVLSGAFMVVAGIFPGDFENRNSTTMLMHTVGSFGSYLFFLVSAFTLPRHLAVSAYWAKIRVATLVCVYASLLFGAWPFVFPTMPGVGQRLVFLFYFAWIAIVAARLYRFKEVQP